MSNFNNNKQIVKQKKKQIQSNSKEESNEDSNDYLEPKIHSKSDVNVISGDKPNILKQRLRKQRFEEQTYWKQSDNNHIRDPLSESINCQICDQTFENNWIYCQHLKTFHDLIESLPFPELFESETISEGRIKCGKCRFKTDSEALMILHSVNHSFISDVFKSSDKLKLKCPTCNHYFSKTLLERHVYIHTSEKPFKCENCGKEFMSRQSLSSHEKQHIIEREVLKCESCGLTFMTDRGFKNHLKIHGSDRKKSHLCDVCGASFFDKESLKAHRIRIHLPKNARRFKCDFDGCRYMTLYHHQLLEHQRTHSDDKPFACDLCQYSAKSKWSFKKHYRRHTKEKPFKCQVCDYSSSLCSNLTRHMRVHTGSKPFKCPHCSYSCNNHENLRKHVLKSKKHFGLNLYYCKHCIFATNSFSELRQHLETKHNDIYSIEEIDKMNHSSFYHKSEDNTTIVTPDTTDQSSQI